MPKPRKKQNKQKQNQMLKRLIPTPATPFGAMNINASNSLSTLPIVGQHGSHTSAVPSQPIIIVIDHNQNGKMQQAASSAKAHASTQSTTTRNADASTQYGMVRMVDASTQPKVVRMVDASTQSGLVQMVDASTQPLVVRMVDASTQPDTVRTADASTQGRYGNMANAAVQTTPYLPFTFASTPTHSSTRNKRRDLKSMLQQRQETRLSKATDYNTIKTDGLQRRGAALDNHALKIRQSNLMLKRMNMSGT